MSDGTESKSIGKYQVIEQLGAGGMATVYRALDPESRREVAVKVLPIHMASHEKMRKRFQREAHTITRLRHPNILPLLDYGEDNDAPFMVMPLISGGTLAALIRKEPVSLKYAAQLIVQIGGALEHAHNQGVIHRDIKPDNILINKQGKPYLTDFGVARALEDSGQLTGTGGFLGTAAYASPEQIKGEELTPTSDIYSFGILIYEMVTGEIPFTGSNPMAIMQKHISENVPNPMKLNPDLPIEMVEVIRKATAKLSTARYQSARSLCDAVVRALRKAIPMTGTLDSYAPRGPDPQFDSRGRVRPHLKETARLGQTAPLPPPPGTRTTQPARQTTPEQNAEDWVFFFLIAILLALLAGGVVLIFMVR